MAIDRDDQGAIDALDREWESLARGDSPPPALDTATGATVHRLHRLADVPGPDPTFVNRLEENLMNQAQATTAGRAARELPFPRPPGSSPAATGPRSRWAGVHIIELAAAALLIALIGGGLYLSRGPGQPGQMPPTQMSGFALETVTAAATPDGTPAAPAGDGTAMDLGNAARTSVVDEPGPRHQPGIIDAIDIAPDLTSTGHMLATADTVYFTAVTTGPGGSEGAGPQRVLVAIDRGSGNERWRVGLHSAEGFLQPTVAVSGDQIFVSLAFDSETSSASQGELIALDTQSGRETWRVELPESGLTAPAVANSAVYAGAVDGSVLAFDAASGEELWRSTAPRISSPNEENWLSTVAISDGMVFASGQSGVLFALDATTGDERWRFDPGLLMDAQPVVAEGRVFHSGIYEGTSVDDLNPVRRLVALDAATGDELWRHDVPADGSVTNVVATADLVAVTHFVQGSNDSRLVAYDALTGAERWSFAPETYLDRQPFVAGGVLYTTGWGDGLDLPGPLDGLLGLDPSSQLYALDLKTGQELWRTGIDQMVVLQVAVSGGDLLLVDHFEQEGNQTNAIYVYGDGTP